MPWALRFSLFMSSLGTGNSTSQIFPSWHKAAIWWASFTALSLQSINSASNLFLILIIYAQCSSAQIRKDRATTWTCTLALSTFWLGQAPFCLKWFFDDEPGCSGALWSCCTTKSLHLAKPAKRSPIHQCNNLTGWSGTWKWKMNWMSLFGNAIAAKSLSTCLAGSDRNETGASVCTSFNMNISYGRIGSSCSFCRFWWCMIFVCALRLGFAARKPTENSTGFGTYHDLVACFLFPSHIKWNLESLLVKAEPIETKLILVVHC